ncbi:MAG: hypothetical protein RSB86_10730 [Comamonas sp.]|uniref:hypothetical protein n=1 Tax=Comamonas sp. TaxID=34028 RepID=UPI002FCBEF6B
MDGANERFAFNGSLVQARLSFFWFGCAGVICCFSGVKESLFALIGGNFGTFKTSQVLPLRADTSAMTRGDVLSS